MQTSSPLSAYSGRACLACVEAVARADRHAEVGVQECAGCGAVCCLHVLTGNPFFPGDYCATCNDRCWSVAT